MEYKIVRWESGKERFEQLVTEYLNSGWELVGGVSISHNGSTIVYAQALTKK
jgi:hypothetical protein